MFGKTLLLVFTLFAAALSAEETFDTAGFTRLEYDGAAQNAEEREIKVSVDYKLSTLSLSLKYLGSGSILTWRDVYMHGARAAVELDTFLFGYEKAAVSAGFSGSAHGYFTDDDATNEVGSIGVMSGEITSLELACDLFDEEVLSPRVRMDFNWLKIENYDLQTLGAQYNQPLPGLINTYDMYRLSFSGGIQAKLAASNGFYANLYGYAGSGVYLGIANWIHNSHYQHPVSFSDFGMYFRGGVEFEFGFKIEGFTLFSVLQGFYEISPGLGLDIQYLTRGGIGRQSIFLDLFSASCGLGIKAEL
jgi:hypothetical protein